MNTNFEKKKQLINLNNEQQYTIVSKYIVTVCVERMLINFKDSKNIILFNLRSMDWTAVNPCHIEYAIVNMQFADKFKCFKFGIPKNHKPLSLLIPDLLKCKTTIDCNPIKLNKYIS